MLLVFPFELDCRADDGRGVLRSLVFLEVVGDKVEINSEIGNALPDKTNVPKPESERLLVSGGLVEEFLPFCQPVVRVLTLASPGVLCP